MKRKLVVKIKYRGQWRKVVGITYHNGIQYYMAQADDKIGYQPVRVGNPDIMAVEEQFRNYYPSSKKRYKQIDETTKHLIYYRFISGAYYQKELCEIHNITPYTLNKIVDELKGVK